MLPSLPASSQPRTLKVRVKVVSVSVQVREIQGMKAPPLPWLGVFGRQSYVLPGRHAELLLPVCLEGVEYCGKVVVTLSPHPGLVILVTVVLEKRR